jgi:hypothetical protein
MTRNHYIKEQIKIYLEHINRLKILKAPVTITFSPKRQTCYSPIFREINIDFAAIDNDPNYDLIYDTITKNEEELSNFFSFEEVIFFHELGHAFDIDNCDYRMEDLHSITGQRLEMESIARDVIESIRKQDEEGDLVDFAIDELSKMYREFPLEKEADEIAYLLMKYFKSL